MNGEDFRLLRTIAGGVVQLSEVASPGAFSLPYPADAQRALDQVAMACLLRGEPLPRSLPDLITWCAQRPVRDWPLAVSPDQAATGDRLVEPHTRTPTQLCYEWALRVPDTRTELYERHVMLGAMSLCRGAGAPESYTAFRRLLIEHPVLTKGELALLNGDPALVPVLDLVRERTTRRPLALQSMATSPPAPGAGACSSRQRRTTGGASRTGAAAREQPGQVPGTAPTRKSCTWRGHCGSSSPAPAGRRSNWSASSPGSGWRWRCGPTTTPTTCACTCPAGAPGRSM